MAEDAVKLREQFQQRRDITPAFRAGQPRDDFLIFEQDFCGNRERDPAIKQRAKNRVKRLLPAKDLKKDAGIETDGNA